MRDWYLRNPKVMKQKTMHAYAPFIFFKVKPKIHIADFLRVLRSRKICYNYITFFRL